ncbi:MAG TPA: stage II sporulation protein M [Thermoanaerobaculia bacterium]|nr:stage II sporulation protein M [Thermoanaerobaculia bacterium]HXT49555.1 stage II sporulation protein M [Thermoanaerobaculia bacterium]
MDYARFVALRRPLWDSFERDATAARRRDFSYAEVEELALRYRQVLHDHAWARARFPGTGAAQRLHRLAVLGGTVLQREDEERFSIVRFFFERFPAAVRASVPWIGVAVALFLVSGLLGWAVAVYEPGVAVATLGPDRVEDLRRGHLWTESLTTTVPPSISSSFIATNNMSVALTAWAGGALAGLGSLWVAIFNGFLLGAIFGVTARFSMAGELGEFVVAHGLLELTLILVCAGAGLGIGAALLRAGDLPRSVTVPRAAREALVVLFGCLPWFLLLGMVEAFLSPSPHLAFHWKLLLGFALEICFLTPIALGLLRQPVPAWPLEGTP